MRGKSGNTGSKSISNAIVPSTRPTNPMRQRGVKYLFIELPIPYRMTDSPSDDSSHRFPSIGQSGLFQLFIIIESFTDHSYSTKNSKNTIQRTIGTALIFPKSTQRL